MPHYFAVIELHKESDALEIADDMKRLGWESLSVRRGLYRTKSNLSIAELFESVSQAVSSPERPAEILLIESAAHLGP